MELVGSVRLAVEAGVVVCCLDCLDPEFRYAGETAGESRTPVVAGVVDGGAYGRRPLVGGIDVVAPTLHFLTCSGENP